MSQGAPMKSLARAGFHLRLQFVVESILTLFKRVVGSKQRANCRLKRKKTCSVGESPVTK